MRNYVFFAERPVSDYRKSDTLFIAIVVLLWGLGLFTLFVSTPFVGERFFGSRYYFVVRHVSASVLGVASMITFAVLPMKVIKRFSFMLAAFSFVLCVMTFIPAFRDEKNGAARWISIGSLSFQPSELVKLSIVLYLSFLFDKHSSEYEEDSKESLYPIAALVLFSLIIARQKDLSTSMFVLGLGFSIFLISGTSVKWILPIITLAIPAGILMILTEQYRLNRILAYIMPEQYKSTTYFQNLVASRAIHSGGFFGVGTGVELERVSRIPEVQTDYIFAGWATSMGALGVTLFFILIAAFAVRGFRIAFRCPNRFAAYGAFGCTLSIFVQTVLNCGVVSGSLPTTGIPLPFFSSGGSSLIVTMAMCGFIINASHCSQESDDEFVDIGRKKDKKKKNSSETDDEIESFGGVVVEYE